MLDVHTIDEYQKALQFMQEGLKTNKNPKPVGEHSVSVANRLLEAGYTGDIIIAALLHDLVEDTDTKSEDITQLFGVTVGNLVDCMTYDSPSLPLEDKMEKFNQHLKKAIEYGEQALALDAADFVDNSHYYHLADSVHTKKYLVKKYETFMEEAKDILQDTKIWNEVEASYRKNIIPLK